MNTDPNTNDKPSPSRRKIEARRQGIFFLLGGLIFLFQALFHLNDELAWILVVVLAMVYGLFFQTKAERTQAPQGRMVARMIVQFALLAAAAVAVVFVWAWIWNVTGFPFPYMAAITCGLLAAGLVGWSYT